MHFRKFTLRKVSVTPKTSLWRFARIFVSRFRRRDGSKARIPGLCLPNEIQLQSQEDKTNDGPDILFFHFPFVSFKNICSRYIFFIRVQTQLKAVDVKFSDEFWEICSFLFAFFCAIKIYFWVEGLFRIRIQKFYFEWSRVRIYWNPS